MRGVVGSAQIGIEVQQLARRQHALVDEYLGREAADVELLRLSQRRVAAQTVARALADQIELALECLALEARAGSDEQLLDERSRVTGAVTKIGRVGVGRHDAPADEHLAFLRAQVRDRRLAAIALGQVRRQEHEAGSELAGARQRYREGFLRDSRQKLEGQRRDHARAVAGVGLGAARAAVVHPAQQMVRVLDDLVAALTFDVRDEAHAAAVVLELGPIQPLSRREAGAVCFSHACRSSCRKSVHDATIGARPFGRAGSLRFRVSRSCSHGSIQRSAVGSAWLVFLAGWQFCDAGPVKPPAIRSAAERSYIEGPEQALCQRQTIGNAATTRQSGPRAGRITALASGSPCRRRSEWRRTRDRYPRTWP